MSRSFPQYGRSCERLCALWMALRNGCLLNGVCYIRATRSQRQKPASDSRALVSLSAVCHAGWLFHLLAESSGVKSLSKNGLPLMTMWHMKWLLLYESLCVSPSSFDCQTRVEFRWDCRVYSAPGQILLWHWASIFIHCPEMMTQIFQILCNTVKSCKCWLTPATVTVHFMLLIIIIYIH